MMGFIFYEMIEELNAIIDMKLKSPLFQRAF